MLLTPLTNRALQVSILFVRFFLFANNENDGYLHFNGCTV